MREEKGDEAGFLEGASAQYDLAGKVIGLAMKVHRTLGPGFSESVYENALAHELSQAGVNFERQKPLTVGYDTAKVGEFICDFLINGQLIVELKAGLSLNPAHEVQLVKYLTATNQQIGLLLNFGASKLEFRKKFPDFSPSFNSLDSVKNGGFTLLEVLVAVAVLALLVVMLMGLVDGATRMWRLNENRVESYREARAALNLISSDLRAFHPSTNRAFFLTNLPGADASTPNTAQIGFLTAQPQSAQDTNSRSDLCTAAYFLAYGKPTRFSPVSSFNLYRFFKESNETWTNLTANSPLVTAADPSNPSVELLARNILDFQVTPLDTNFSRWTYTTSDPLPTALEIKVVAVNNERTQRLNSRADWENFRTATNSADYREHTRTFITRLPLRQPAKP